MDKPFIGASQCRSDDRKSIFRGVPRRTPKFMEPPKVAEKFTGKASRGFYDAPNIQNALKRRRKNPGRGFGRFLRFRRAYVIPIPEKSPRKMSWLADHLSMHVSRVRDTKRKIALALCALARDCVRSQSLLHDCAQKKVRRLLRTSKDPGR